MKVLVTGASGYLGRVVCAQLVAAGHSVRALQRHAHPDLAALGIDQRLGDLADLEAVMSASEDIEGIVHLGAATAAASPIETSYDVNVVGTDHVLAACELNGVRRLVFASSASVVFEGGDLEGVDESAPYARRFVSAYAQTKAWAEQRVLEANSATLGTLALRLDILWGPGEARVLPALLERARAGQLRLPGDVDKRIDTIYVDNAAHAHVLALAALAPGAACAGKAYFVSQGEPVTIEHLVNAWLLAAGLPPGTRATGAPLARTASRVVDTAYGAVGKSAALPRDLADLFSSAHWFNIDAARRDLGYAPQVSITEGLHRLGIALRGERDRHATPA